MKQYLKKLLILLPPGWRAAVVRTYRHSRDSWRLLLALVYDYRLYRRHSGMVHEARECVQNAMITRTYHRIEKGLALPDPRPGFGRIVVDQLATEVAAYQSAYAPGRTTRIALNTMKEYVAFNETHGVPMADVRATWDRLADLQGGVAAHGEGGTLRVDRASILADAQMDLRRFFAARHSVRDFSADPIMPEVLETAVRMAQSAPSVCNRQAGRVYYTRDPIVMQKLLVHQNGNRGFGDRVDTLIVVTVGLDCFLTVGERYQGWIDGGLFAMTLIYALHSLGVGTCCLNWSVEPEVDRRFKSDSGIPERDAIIMLLAAGRLPESFKVAASPRRPIDEVLRKL